jgi:hypothetical protein
MPTNFYFNNFPSSQITSEQLLVEDLVIEAMQIYGMDVYYLPRSTRSEVDYLYGEDQLKQYVQAFPIEMYLENVTGMDGEGDFVSKFGLEIRDELTLLVSRRRFSFTAGRKRPFEGDLVYIPLVRNFYEITFVEHENDQAMFYTLGRGRGGNVYVYALKLKQFLFSNEIISTNVQEIDKQIRDHYSRNTLTLTSVSGKFLNDEIVYQGTDLSNSTAQALVYDFIPNTTLQVYRTQGEFGVSNTLIYGITSGAIANVTVLVDNVSSNSVFEDLYDNKRIQQESDSILDWSEKNPFGEA